MKDFDWCSIFKIIALILLAILIPVLVVALTFGAKQIGWEIKCSDSVLTFIGILATFVVISNQVQIRSIEARINRLEEKVNKSEESIIDAKINSSEYVKYMRFSVGLIINDKGEQLREITQRLSKYENIENRLEEFANGAYEDDTFIRDLEKALNFKRND